MASKRWSNTNAHTLAEGWKNMENTAKTGSSHILANWQAMSNKVREGALERDPLYENTENVKVNGILPPKLRNRRRIFSRTAGLNNKKIPRRGLFNNEVTKRNSRKSRKHRNSRKN
jgi:hypothetical protein